MIKSTLFKMPSTRIFPPYVALVIGVSALSLTGIFVRWADAPGTVTAAYRMGVAALALTPFALRGISKEIKNLSNRWWIFLLTGAFIALDHASLNTAIGLTRIANCTLLNNIAPLWVSLFALLVWREKLKKWFWIGLIFTLGGTVIILSADFIKHPQLGFGDGLAFLSSLFYAGYFLIAQIGRKHFSVLHFAWLANLVSAVLLVAYNLIQGIPLTGYPTRTLLVFFAVGLISQAIGYSSIAYALGHLPASIVSPTMVTQIVLTSLLAIPLNGEALSIPQIIGGIAVIGGIVLINTNRVEIPVKEDTLLQG
jgi:drug/metabolite transporter (DMT)-like permease